MLSNLLIHSKFSQYSFALLYINGKKGKIFLEFIHENLINIAFITYDSWTYVRLQLVFIC